MTTRRFAAVVVSTVSLLLWQQQSSNHVIVAASPTLTGATANHADSILNKNATTAAARKNNSTNHTKNSTKTKKCSLSCLHGGVCKMGKGQYGFSSFSEDNDPRPFSMQTPFKDGMYCQCPTGFTGQTCEIKYRVCNTAQDVCPNGKPCQRDWDDVGQVFYRCGCDAQQSNLTATYAAQFCQRASGTVFCPTITNNNNNSSSSIGPAFCTNGGTCPQISQAKKSWLSSSPFSSSSSSSATLPPTTTTTTTTTLSCTCPAGWEGPHCEFTQGTMMQPKKFDPTPAGISGLVVASFTGFVLMLLALICLYRTTCRSSSSSSSGLRCYCCWSNNSAKKDAVGAAAAVVAPELQLEADGSATLGAAAKRRGSSSTSSTSSSRRGGPHALDSSPTSSTCHKSGRDSPTELSSSVNAGTTTTTAPRNLPPAKAFTGVPDIV